MPLQLVSTDFDGTIFAEFENPPLAPEFVTRIAELQAQGVRWVINTGRDMSSLMEALGRAHLPVQPDFLVLVEREIYLHRDSRYVPHQPWNDDCARSHAEVFARLSPRVPELVAWINARFTATLYADAHSPLCLIAGNNGDADQIVARWEEVCREVPELVVVRNDVYARFSHLNFNKGTALRELSRLLGIAPAEVFAAGDHLNDLPMLRREHAAWLAAPANAVPAVRAAIAAQGGHLSRLPQGRGVAEGLALAWRAAAARH